VLTGFLVRVAALQQVYDIAPVLDEMLYLQRAHGLLEGLGHLGSFQSWVRHPKLARKTYMAYLPQYPGAYQPPFYSVFIAAIMSIPGRSMFAVKFVQVILSSISILLVYLIGRSWFGHRQGIIAASIFAFYPNLISFSHLIWSETLFSFMLLLVFWLLSDPMEPTTNRRSALIGILFGLLALTRSTIIYFLPIVFVWLIFIHWSKWVQTMRSVAIILMATVFVVTPWAIRNYFVHGGFVLIESNGPTNLWRGNAPTTFQYRPDSPAWSYKPPFQSLPMNPVRTQPVFLLIEEVKKVLNVPYPTDLQIMSCSKKLAWNYIRNNPVLFLKRVPYKIIDMWNPTSFMIRHLRRGWYGAVAPQTEFILTWLAVVSYIAVMCLGAIGLSLGWRHGQTWLIVSMLVFYTAISAVAFGLTRFRIPLMPFIIIAASHGLTWVACRLRGQHSRQSSST
jgi:4-amino-4-deoxy-L-arabinose transferase-like glycosyltransferase